jgi:tetratricopeptide (TPR) repeat protein
MIILLLYAFLTRADTTKVYTPTEYQYLDLADEMIKKKDYKKAIKHLKLVIKINPYNQRAHRTLGKVYEKQKDIDKVISHYQWFLHKFGPDAEVAFKLAFYLKGRKKATERKKAIHYYRMGLEVKDNPMARRQLARLLVRQKDLDAAINEYRILVAGNPKNTKFQKEYCELLEKDDRYRTEAIQEYRKLVQRLPRDYVLHLHLARLLAREDKHYDEACQLYGVLVENRPTYPMLRREYAFLLAKDSKHFIKAKVEFEKLFTMEDNFNNRLGYADFLATNKNARQEALTEYQKLLKKKPKYWKVRLKYAQLLGADQNTYDQAVKQYKMVLKRNRKAVGAHQGLAGIYAWQGKSNLAIHHKELAFKYEPKPNKQPQLDTTLKQRRKPVVGTKLSLRNQLNGPWELIHTQLTVDGTMAFLPSLRGNLVFGTEYYQTPTQKLNGVVAHLSIHNDITPANLLIFALDIHSILPAWYKNGFLFKYSYRKRKAVLELGIKRQLRDDSMTALAREDFSIQDQGVASENLVFAGFGYTFRKFKFELKPYGGIITMDTVEANPLFGTDLSASFLLFGKGRIHIWAEYFMELDHYDQDYSGFSASTSEPLAGGYFSPDLYINHCPCLVYLYRMLDRKELHIKGGPSIQLVEGSQGRGEYQAGAFLDILYMHKLKKKVYYQINAGHTQIVKAYRRYQLNGSLSYVF